MIVFLVRLVTIVEVLVCQQHLDLVMQDFIVCLERGQANQQKLAIIRHLTVSVQITKLEDSVQLVLFVQLVQMNPNNALEDTSVKLMVWVPKQASVTVVTTAQPVLLYRIQQMA